MARKRKITSDDILDAAERVAVRCGATRISIDAVAQEAKVNKSRVVYDHKSKSALLEALIDRRMQRDSVRLKDCIAESVHTPNPELFGRILLAEREPGEVERAVTFSVCASGAPQDRFHQQLREWTKWDLKEVMKGSHPTAALMSYLALTGFATIEYCNFHKWKASERAEILEGLRQIYTSFPEPAKPGA